MAHKWIYVLPELPSPPTGNGYTQHPVILVAEDMHIVPKNENLVAWKYLVTPKILQEFYTIINQAGGNSYRASNVPYTYSGKFAFIDTEYPYKRPNFRTILPYLSEEMKIYWEQVIYDHE